MQIKDIQTELKKNRLNARIFTLNNLFLNEDILPEENRILELTGFSGSYALLVVTINKAYLFVDGRYELQAKNEVKSRQIDIIKLSEISFIDWLKQNLSKKNTRIAYNPWTISIDNLDNYQKELPLAQFIALSNPSLNLSSKKVKVYPHQKKYTGATTKEKIALVAKYLTSKKLDAYLITSAANVSWLLNLRSQALPYTPLFRAYVLLEKNGNYKVFAEHTDYKEAIDFEKLPDYLDKYPHIGADFALTPAIIKDFFKNLENIHDTITDLKAVKNKTEIKGMRDAHLRDGVALTKFIYWLSKNYAGKTETEVAEKLLSFRQKEINFKTESFATIAGFGPNAAIVHYHAKKSKSAILKKHSLILIDSGGQYYDGTTDVTRTIALGTPTADMIEKNTYVLKAHIALASALFYQNTAGSKLDLIARQPLLRQGLDYEHGTGHGVGYFSDVHEGPCSISSLTTNTAPLKAGMITSIEPGYYKEKAYGIRIENLYYIKPNQNKKLLNFEVLTLAPIDKKLINKYLLSAEEIAWLNRYHRQVFLSLKKYLTKQELEWFKTACAPL